MKKIILLFCIVSSVLAQDKCKTSYMREMVNETNSILPLRIDELTIAENMICVNNKAIYNMTLIDSDEINWAYLNQNEILIEKNIKTKQIQNNYCSHPDLKIFRDLGIVLRYDYSLQNGIFFFSITAKPTNCIDF